MEAVVFRGETMVAAGDKLTKNSSEAREVLDDLYILEKKKKATPNGYKLKKRVNRSFIVGKKKKNLCAKLSVQFSQVGIVQNQILGSNFACERKRSARLVDFLIVDT